MGRERGINGWEKVENRVEGHSSEGRKGLLFVQQKCDVSNLKTHELLLKEK